MHRDLASMTAFRASGAVPGVRAVGFTMSTIITMTTRITGASG